MLAILRQFRPTITKQNLLLHTFLAMGAFAISWPHAIVGATLFCGASGIIHFIKNKIGPIWQWCLSIKKTTANIIYALFKANPFSLLNRLAVLRDQVSRHCHHMDRLTAAIMQTIAITNRRLDKIKSACANIMATVARTNNTYRQTFTQHQHNKLTIARIEQQHTSIHTMLHSMRTTIDKGFLQISTDLNQVKASQQTMHALLDQAMHKVNRCPATKTRSKDNWHRSNAIPLC